MNLFISKLPANVSRFGCEPPQGFGVRLSSAALGSTDLRGNESRYGFQSRARLQQGFFLEEALVYISVLLVLLGVGFSALYRSIDSSVGLRRNADDITSAIHAGERWRADVRAADSKAWLEKNSPEAILHLPSSNGEITYRSAPPAIYRRVGSGPWVCALTNVASSIMESDSRQNVIAWRWELELQHRAKGSYIRPLFTFLAVPQPKAAL